MKLCRVSQLELDEVYSTKVDLVLAASGYEARSSYLAAKLATTGDMRLALGFEEFRDLDQRRHNDSIYYRLGYEVVILPGGSSSRVAEIFCRAVESLGGSSATILVDISSMTRSWYGAIIRSIRYGKFAQSRLKVIFSYVPAAFQRRLEKYPQNRYVGPVQGFTSLALPTLPTALVVGLGQDYGRALGIHAEIDPGITASFLASPGTDRRYEPAVRQANEQFLELVEPENQFAYSLLDFPGTFFRLRDITSVLTEEWRVVMAALGPKIFALSCFLVATEIPRTSVWRVSAGERIRPVDRHAGRSMVFAETEWTRAQDDDST